MNLISTDVLSEFNEVFSSDTLREEQDRAEEILLPMEEEEEVMPEIVDMLIEPSNQKTGCSLRRFGPCGDKGDAERAHGFFT